jgi:hypothetical protein
MDAFLDKYNSPRQNYEKKGNMNRTIMNKEIESVMKILLKEKPRI